MTAATSSTDVVQIGVAHALLGERPVWVQDEFSSAFLPWRPLGGIANAMDRAECHRAIQQAADETGTGVHRVTHARNLALAPGAVPIPRASGSASIRDSAAAADLELTADQFAIPSV
ncbi:hypothetical protein ABZ379_49165 [Streptomyces canus]|uniref:hypothetical protein n=1 Tax=Streptomyces canus TaxID=58343 RepID=UPI0033E29E07